MRARLRRFRLTREHVFRLLGSLALALVIWVYVTINQNPETLFPFEGVSVEVQQLAEGFVLTDAQGIPLPALKTVSLAVRAPQAEHLAADDFRVYVDMSMIQEAGTYDLPVTVQVPQGVRTWTIKPEKVTVRVEQMAHEILPIKVQLLGQPGLPYIVGSPRVSPAQALVQGPLSRVQLVDTVQARVDLGGRVASLTNAPVKLAALDSANDEVSGVTLIPAEATVNVPIALQGGHIAVSVVPVLTGQPAPGYYVRALEVIPDTVTIFSGDPSVLATVRYLETTALSVAGLGSNFSTTVDLNLPPNVSLINSPAQVTVTVRFGAIAPQLRLAIPVHLEGLDPALQATWEPQWLDVLVRAPLELLQELSLADLWVIVDVSGRDAGEYDLPVTFQAPPRIEVSPADRSSVHVVVVRPVTPTPTVTPTLTPTLAPKLTPSPTATATATSSPTATATPTASSTLTPTLAPLPPTPTLPPPTKPTAGPSPTPTPGPSPTPSPLPSPTP